MDLGGIAIREALARSGVAGDQVDYVIRGHVIQAEAGQSPPRGHDRIRSTDQPVLPPNQGARPERSL